MQRAASEKILYLIDGHAQIFRAYFAIRGGMSSPVTGEPTHAVFGFAGMLIKLFDQYRPDYVAMAIDTPGKTFRDELYSEYKAHRDPAPDDFQPQADRIFEMTAQFGIPILAVPGAEADDVIATCVRSVLEDPNLANLNVRIVSRDKDFEQLLSERVCLFDIHKDETIDVETLSREKGIRPDQVIDILALMGDKVDNIPGVVGIGPKTAAALIGEYGSIDGILANIDKIKGKRRQNIEAARDQLPLNRKLVTLKKDIEVTFDPETAKSAVADVAGLRQLFETLGFHRHRQDLDRLITSPNAAGPKPADDHVVQESEQSPESRRGDGQQQLLFADTPIAVAEKNHEQLLPEGYSTADACDYRAVTTREELDHLIAALREAPIISVDTETIGLGRRAKLCGLAFAWQNYQGVYVPVVSHESADHLDRQTVLTALRAVLEDPDRPKCGHNLKYDALVLRHAGISLRGVAFDSMIASHLLGFTSRSLDHLARSMLQHAMIPISQLIGPKERQQATIDQIPLDQVTPYAAEDADMALRLHEKLIPQLIDAGMERLAAVEMPLVEALADMECNGIRVNPDELSRQKDDLTGRIEQLQRQIYQAAGTEFNLDSPKQLADILFNQLGLPIGKRGKTGPSTDVEVLERLASREDLPSDKTAVAKLIVEYRQFAKLVNTYLGNLSHNISKQDGRIHASFHQLGAATGRLSSGGPNLQNIPVRTQVGRQIRKAFVAEPGYLLICADYSQIELRILAHLSQDAALIEAFNNDMDIHQAVAAEVFGVKLEDVTSEQRAHAKVINFGIIYGVTAWGLARRIEGLDKTAAAELIANYRKRFPGIDRFLQHCVSEAIEKGYVETMLGRRRRIEQINSRQSATRALGERLAINTVVQGSATGDLIKTAMVNLYHRIHDDHLPMKLLVQIHDELLFEAPAEVAPEQAKIVREEMEGAMSLRVPLKVDVGIGPDWFSAK